MGVHQMDALSLFGEEELREISVPLGPGEKILHSEDAAPG
jgi:hypothetical protein